MNDAVAIILFQVVGDLFESVSPEGVGEEKGAFLLVLGIIWGFLLNVITSLAIGTACGNYSLISALLCSKIFQKMRFLTDNPVL